MARAVEVVFHDPEKRKPAMASKVLVLTKDNEYLIGRYAEYYGLKENGGKGVMCIQSSYILPYSQIKEWTYLPKVEL